MQNRNHVIALAGTQGGLYQKVEKNLAASGAELVDVHAAAALDDLIFIFDEAEGDGDILTCDYVSWRKTLEDELDGAIELVQKAVPLMKQHEGSDVPAHIVFVVPAAALSAAPGGVASAAAAFALRGFARHLAINIGENNILVNVLGVEETGASHAETCALIETLLGEDGDNVTGLTVNVGQAQLIQ